MQNGRPMNRALASATLSLLALGAACTGPGKQNPADNPSAPASPVLQDGRIYTPVSQGNDGCLLYSVRVSGGKAPSALVYQSEDGRFSYDHPERCVKAPDWQP